MKLYRFEVYGEGVYAAVEKSCPRSDGRRQFKPDGSWLPRVGAKYPGATSYWTEAGLKAYTDSGLRAWHASVANGPLEIVECDSSEIEILYADEYQVIGNIKD